MSIELINKYIEEWQCIEGQKPMNDERFIELFTEFARSSEIGCWEFSGNNDYCGFTAILHESDPRYNWHAVTCFEFAFRINEPLVKVFNGNHNGFWVPEYIDLTSGDAAPLLGILKDKAMEWCGFQLNTNKER